MDSRRRIWNITGTKRRKTQHPSALAGANLNLPVYHVTESEIKEQIDPAVYEEHIGLAELAMDVDDIAAAMQQVRSDAGL